MKTWFHMKAGEAADEIDIFDEIGVWGVTAKDFISDLRALKRPEITLSINSPGGSVFDGIAMYNALRNSGKKVTCRVLGVAASAASFVAMAGDTVQMSPQSMMMIHDAMGITMGNADDHRRQVAITCRSSRGILRAMMRPSVGSDSQTDFRITLQPPPAR